MRVAWRLARIRMEYAGHALEEEPPAVGVVAITADWTGAREMPKPRAGNSGGDPGEPIAGVAEDVAGIASRNENSGISLGIGIRTDRDEHVGSSSDFEADRVQIRRSEIRDARARHRKRPNWLLRQCYALQNPHLNAGDVKT